MTKNPEVAAVKSQNIPSLISHASSRPDAKAIQAISNAIHALNQQNGIAFGPLTLKCVNGAFWNIWNSQRGDTPITFFQSNPAAGGSNGIGAFLPLGDYATPGASYDLATVPNAPGNQILFAPTSDATVVAHPAGFSWILDDAGSDNSRNISYYTIVPPPGYVALGVACTGGGAPNPDAYWCVRSDFARAVAAREIWSDNGQRWRHHNGNISAPIANLAMPEPSMLFAPQTFLSAEGGNPAYALVLQQADLQVSTFDTDAPKYDLTITSGDVTSFGLQSAKIVPYTALADPGYVNQSTSSPFYVVVAEPYWQCTMVLSTPQGGNFQVTQTVGTGQTDSQSFSQSTSMTVGADVGVAYEGVSASVSTSYTQSFGTSVSHTASRSTQVQTQITLNLPQQKTTWIWERQTQISVFRTDTTQLAPVIYSEPDIIFVPS
jgi:Insecticidal Crystal Toxin, P42